MSTIPQLFYKLIMKYETLVINNLLDFLDFDLFFFAFPLNEECSDDLSSAKSGSNKSLGLLTF